MSTVGSPDDFIESFPNSIPKIEGPPTYDTLRIIRDLLKANAASVSSTRGGGSHGYLGMVVSANVYATIDPTAWTIPQYPGAQPNIAAGATAAQINEEVRVHAEAKREWREYNNVEQALRKQLVDAIEPIFLRSQKDRHVGFTNVPLRLLLAYLFTTYGNIQPTDLDQNEKNASTPWDPNTPFEHLIDQIEDAQEFATAGNQSYTDNQIVNKAYTLVYNTGVFFDDCKAWRRRPEAEHTWINFKAHFLQAQLDYRLQTATTRGSGYANMARDQPTDTMPPVFADSLANFATAAASDREAFANLTTTNTALTKSNAELTKALADALKRIAELEKKNNTRRTPRPDNGNYCWSHGYRCADDHDSSSCLHPKEGHQKDATRANTMGVNTVNHFINNTNRCPPQRTLHSPAIIDTGTTGHFLVPNTACLHKRPTHAPVHVQLPNGDHISSSHTADIALPHLPAAAQTAHVFPDLTPHALLSVGQLCDHGCTATFTKDAVVITHGTNTVLRGQRDANKLWIADLATSAQPPNADDPPHAASAALETRSQSELLRFLHAACFSPVKSTWVRAIRNGHFTTWPGLTPEAVNKHLPKSIATAKGHLDQKRQNTQSTQPTLANDEDFSPSSLTPKADVTNFVFVATIMVPTRTGMIHTDQTGRFPVQSSRGFKYVMVLYEYDSNAILARPLKNRTDSELQRVYNSMHELLVSRGLRPRLQRLDNEASKSLKQFLRSENIDFQLAPPDIHRRNAAERAIRTFKNHFVAGLSSTDPAYPLFLWDRLLPQAELTLNLLRSSRINPKLSAYAQLHGAFDYNRTPLAPPGTRILAHVKPRSRRTWAPHGDDGWYIGPAMEHYRCYRVYIPKTNSDRITDTIEFFPAHTPMPKMSTADHAIRAAKELIECLRHPAPAAPFHHIGDARLDALAQLASIFDAALPGVPDTADTPSSIRRSDPPPKLNAPTVAPPAPPTSAPRHRYNTRSHRANYAAILPKSLPAATIPRTSPDTPLSDVFLTDPPPTFSPLSYANAVIDPETGHAMEYRELISNPKTKDVWIRSAENEFGRLTTGIRDIPGTDTIRFIKKNDMPPGRRATYPRFVCVERPQKKEVQRTRITVGGNLIDYPGDVSTRTAGITTAKIHWNSVLSTPNAKYCCFDLKNFYLCTPLDRYEYMRFHLTDIPEHFIKKFKLRSIADSNGYVYAEIVRTMYGLPQAGMLANKQLAQRLATSGYYQTMHTPGFWKHTWRPISFTLIVDDFGVKYVGREHANHLHRILQTYYEVSADWTGSLYCGITLNWNYKVRTLECSMPKYVPAALHRFQHPKPSRRQHSPHRSNLPQYGVSVQAPEPLDLTPHLTDKSAVLRIQQIIGTFLFYARAIDNTMLVSLSSMSSAQSTATELTQQDINQFLDYAHTHPNAILKFHASDMILHIHSDASYLNETNARSRAGGHHFLGFHSPTAPDKHNGAILNPTGIIKHVVSSASEAELAALFINGKEGVVLRTTLEEMGHPQPATPMQTDNSTAHGITNDSIRQQRSRAMDMRLYWIRDRVRQNQFKVNWKPGTDNKGDYFTKHHPPSHHIKMRPQYLHEPTPTISANASFLTTRQLQGCAESRMTHPGFNHLPLTKELAESPKLQPSKSL